MIGIRTSNKGKENKEKIKPHLHTHQKQDWVGKVAEDMIPNLLSNVPQFEIVISLVRVIVPNNRQSFLRKVLLDLWKNYTIAVVNRTRGRNPRRERGREYVRYLNEGDFEGGEEADLRVRERNGVGDLDDGIFVGVEETAEEEAVDGGGPVF